MDGGTGSTDRGPRINFDMPPSAGLPAERLDDFAVVDCGILGVHAGRLRNHSTDRCRWVVIASGHCLFGATACQAEARYRAARAAVSNFPPCVRLRKGLAALPALELGFHHCLVCG